MTGKEIKEALDRFNVLPSKQMGQNFLIDPNMARWIVSQLDLAENDTVVEVGPGLGTLTRTLLGAGVELFAVEADRTMVYHLETTLQPRYPVTFQLHEGDAMDFDMI